jgi:uncharacterized protein
MSGSAPPASQTRIVALDALRGLAVLGIALMNVVAFSMPPNAYINPAVSGWYAFGWLQYWHDYSSGMPVDEAGRELAQRTYGAHPDTMAAAMARGTESFDERIVRRLSTLPGQAGYVVAAIPSSLAAMLLGMAMWRGGLLAGTWQKSRALRLASRCELASLPVLVALAGWTILSGFDVIVTAANAVVWSAPFDIVLAVAYAALAMALFGGGSITRALAAAGRMALTNYVATSLVFSVLFASWGLGLFGEESRGQALLLALVPISLILLWSPWWLARFRQGPLEWLWRSAASGTLLPFRRRR